MKLFKFSNQWQESWNLLLKKSRELCFNLSIQIVMFGHLINIPLSDGRSQVLVVAGHDHLHQILVLEHLIAIRVKVFHYVVCVCFCGLLDAIVS